jgi:hypothetical protein
MRTVLLDDETFARTFVAPMRDVSEDSDPVVDIWSYVRAIPPSESRDLMGRAEEVAYVYRSGDDRFDHVLIPTHAPNVYLVVVVSRSAAAVYGHHHLDLNQKYGLSTPISPAPSPQALAICAAQNVAPDLPANDRIVGIALTTLHLDPLNGLRSSPEGRTCGWYIWGGRDLPDAPDFFASLQVAHLTDRCPSVLPYLALPPGWRFLLGANNHVDVWHDPKLLDDWVATQRSGR